MSMMEAVKSVFSKYAAFSGRARRSEYWYFQLFVLLIHMVFAVFLTHLDLYSTPYYLVSALEGLFSLAVFVPSLAVTWRRMHDIGKSGAWSLLGVVSLLAFCAFVIMLAIVYSATGSSASDAVMASIGLTVIGFFLAMLGIAVVMLIWLTRAGQPFSNRFGPDPRRSEADAPEKAPWEY